MQRWRRRASGQCFHENQWQWHCKREVRLKVRGLSQGRWRIQSERKFELTYSFPKKGKGEIHFCFSSAVTVWETKNPIEASRPHFQGQMLLVTSLFPSENKWRRDCGCALGLCDLQAYLPAEQWLSLKQSEMLNLQGVTVSSLATWGCECFSLLTG